MKEKTIEDIICPGCKQPVLSLHSGFCLACLVLSEEPDPDEDECPYCCTDLDRRGRCPVCDS